jgi:hypothetical protein
LKLGTFGPEVYLWIEQNGSAVAGFRARLFLLLVGENVEEQNILVHVAYNPP